MSNEVRVARNSRNSQLGTRNSKKYKWKNKKTQLVVVKKR
jgi:hypothetical protein